MLITSKSYGENKYSAKLITLDIDEGIDDKYFYSNIKWVILEDNIMREFASTGNIENIDNGKVEKFDNKKEFTIKLI